MVVIFFIIVFSMVGFLKIVKIKTSLLAYFCRIVGRIKSIMSKPLLLLVKIYKKRNDSF